jgi:antitoxin HicB
MLSYRIELVPDDNGTLLVTCPALPEVTTFGNDESDALVHAHEAIEEAIAARMAKWSDVPVQEWTEGTYVRVSLGAWTKIVLYKAMKMQNITRAELARRLGWHREQVDRLFRLDHASRIDQIEKAFAALGQQVDLKLVAA